MKRVIIATLAIATAGSVFASKGFQASLTPDIAVHDRNTEINGVSIGVWNENPSPKFQWQFGFVNGATGDSVGAQWFIFLPTFYNYAQNYKGVQFAVVNNTFGDFVGWQGAFLNMTHGECVGLQSGTINYAKQMHGVQLGAVNYAHTVEDWAFQLGLVNIIADNAWFNEFPGEFAKGFIIANWSFQ